MTFPLLLAGHLIGDWILQNDWMAARKTRSWLANQAHMLAYHATLTAAVLFVWHDRRLLLALAVSWITHSVIDRRWPVVWLLRALNSPRFAEQPWGVLAADQALHIAVLALVSLWGPR